MYGKSPLTVLAHAVIVCVLFVTGCGSSDDAVPPPPAGPPTSAALVVPGVNPGFDTVTEIASSDAAGGDYTAITDFQYDAATETVTLPEDGIPAGGLYIRITGDATVGNVTDSYTVYTFVGSNSDRVAANELTSLAVAFVAEGAATDFATAVGQVAATLGDVASADITSPATEANRDPAVRAAMIALSGTFMNSDFVPGLSDSQAVVASVDACYALGALAYDDMSYVAAGGSGALPTAEPHREYQRCVACHGWDQLGMDGGFARRPRLETQPNAGYQDPDQLRRNISSGLGAHPPVTIDMILRPDIVRSWAEGSAIFDGTDPSWGPGTQKGNEHPDLSPSGVNGSAVPSSEQVRCMAAFLNNPSSQADAVFASINPNPASAPAWCSSSQCVDYTVVPSGDSARGDAWYHDSQGGNCVSCHGEPKDAEGPLTTEPQGGLLAFLRKDGAFSELRHKVQWGRSGSDVKTRQSMNNPTVADVADVVAYLKAELEALVGGLPVAANDTAFTTADTAVDIDVLANDSDPDGDPLTVSAFDATSAQGGTVSCTPAGVCNYAPGAGFTGSDTFGYTVSDSVNTDTATVTVTVSNQGNDAPVAVNDSASTTADTPVDIAVLANDSDADGDSLTVSAFDSSSANGGAVACTAAGICTYTPTSAFTGNDTFGYTASDGTATDTATVTVTVSAPDNTAPVARNDSASTTENTAVQINVRANDSDADGDPLTVSAFDSTSAQGGTVNCTNAGVCTYTPPNGFTGTDTFMYSIFDGVDTDSAVVSITVTAANPVGNPAAGEARYDAECNVCHSYQAYGDNSEQFGAGDLGGKSSELRNNLGQIDSMMSGITLTDQELLDMAAFLEAH